MTDFTTGSAANGRQARIATLASWTVFGLAAACGMALLLGGLGYRWGWWHFRIGIQAIRWAATVDLGVIVLALAAALFAWKTGARRALVPGTAGLLLALVVAAPPLYFWRVADSVPRIHDITTDALDPPQFVAVLPLRAGAENSTRFSPEVAEQQKKAYPDIGPTLLAMSPDDALARAERVARSLGWEIVAVAPGDLRIEATDTTLLFGFKDDVVIRVRAQDKGSRVDVRSVSRVGRSDIGANAKRIRAFMKELSKAEYAGTTGY